MLTTQEAPVGWLVVLGFSSYGYMIAFGDAHVCLLSHTSTNTVFFPKPPSTFLTCFSRGARRKYIGKKVRLNRVSNWQPPDHESDTLTTEAPGRDNVDQDQIVQYVYK